MVTVTVPATSAKDVYKRQAHVLLAVAARGLQNDVNVDVLLGQQAENFERHTGHIRHVLHGQNGDVGVLCNTLDEHTFHSVSYTHLSPNMSSSSSRFRSPSANGSSR